MAGFFRLHNKFHRTSHHTLTGTDTVDGGSDPIASKEFPFNGIFYNNLTDYKRTYNIKTNSFDWNSVYVTVNSLSAEWGLIKTTYTTVNTNSANWEKGFSAYTTLQSVSDNYNSVYTTVCANSAAWSESEFLLYTNRVQQNTRSKTFSGYTLSINQDGSVDWNLDIAQVAFLYLKDNVFLKNPFPSSLKRGGIYHLYVYQNPRPTIDILRFGSNDKLKTFETSNNIVFLDLLANTLDFDENYLFPLNEESSLNYSVSGVTIFNFMCDGEYMHGNSYRTHIIEHIRTFVDYKTIKVFDDVAIVKNTPTIRFTEHLDYLGTFGNKERIFKLGTSLQKPIIRYP
jgi:hypothetical protein